MADRVANLSIRINLDGAEAASARLKNLSQASSELKERLASIGAAIKASQAAGDPLKTEQLKESSREIEQTIARLGRLREAVRIDYARGILDVRPWRDIQREIAQAQAAFGRLAASGKLSTGELAQAFARLQSRIVELKSQTNSFGEGFDRIKAGLAGFAAGIGTFGLGVRNFTAFETAILGVQRAANLTRAEAEAMGREFQAMSTRIAVGANDIARIAAMGAKFGVAKEDLARFAEYVSIAARQFEMIPDEAGRALGILSRILDVSIEDMDAFIGMMNALADSVGVAERDIVTALTLAGGDAMQFGLRREQAAALATAFLAAGASAEQAATAMRTLLGRLQMAAQDSGQAGQALRLLVGDTRAFAREIDSNAQAALNRFLTKLSQLGREDRLKIIRDMLGEGLDTSNILKLVDGLEQYQAAQNTAGQGAERFRAQLDALNDIDLSSLAAEWRNFTNALENLGSALGETIAPLVKQVISLLRGATVALTGFIERFPLFSAAVGIFATLAAGLSGLRLVLGGVVLLFGKLANAARAVLAPLSGLGAGLTAVTASAPMLLRVLGLLRAFAGPIGLATTAILFGIDAFRRFKKSAEDAGDAVQNVASNQGMTQWRASLDAAAKSLRDIDAAATRVGVTIRQALEVETKNAAETVKRLPESYRQVAADIKAIWDARVAEIESSYKLQEDAAKRVARSEADSIRESAQALFAAEREKLAAVESAARQMESAWKATYGQAVALARTAGQEVQAIERQAVEARIAIYSQLESAYRATVDRLIAEEQRHLQAAKSAEEARLNLRLSIEDRIRELSRKGMDEYAAYQDRLRQIDEKQAQARAALAAGNFEIARKLAEEAIALAERSASAVTRQVEQDGKTVTQTIVSEGQAAATAITEIKEAAAIADAALKGLGDAHKQAANEASRAAEEAKRALASVFDELNKLRESLLAQDKIKLDVDVEAAKVGIEKLKALTEAQAIVAKIQADTKEAQSSLEKLKSDVGNLQLLAKVEADTSQVMADIDRLKGALAGAGLEIQALASFAQARQQLATFAQEVKTVLSAPTSATHTVQPNLSQYRAAISELSRPTSSTHTIYVNKVYTNAQGGLIQRLADGGRVVVNKFKRMSGRIIGPGTSTSDSVPALLSHGEFVIRASSVRKFGEAFFAALNAGFLPALPRFATGSAVAGAVSRMAAGDSSLTARNVVDLRIHIGGRVHTVQSSRETAMQLAHALRELSRGA